MIEWERRPVEVASLLNPAFCGVLIREAVASHLTEVNTGMPFALAFLILPIVLHENTRQRLPRSMRTSMHAWLQEHPEVKLGFADRARTLVPFSQEAVSFLLRQQALIVGPEGALVVGPRVPRSISQIPNRTPDFDDCVARARFLGRWLSRSGSVPAIYQFWGVRP